MSMVEWKKLGEICEIGTGSNNREDACEGGIYPFYVRSQEVLRINSFLYDEEAILIPGEGGVGDIFHYINGKYGLHQRTYRVHPISNTIIGKYIYYYLFANFKTYITQKSYKSTAASIRKPMLTGFPICFPSISKQQRIVKQLDTFTSSIENLKEQIAQRRKQYEYYRDQLLDLEGKLGVEMKTLGDIMQIVRGASPRPIKNFITTKEDGINWIKIGDVAPGAKYVTSCNEKITKAGAEKSRFLHAGDFILSNSMSFGRPYILKIDGCIHDGWIAMSDFEKDVLPDYLYEYLNSDVVQKYWIMKANNGGAMTNLNSDIVKATPIYIPPLQEQHRIVSILDTFEASIQNLEQQLAQREKQYEYYRNKLLTFE